MKSIEELEKIAVIIDADNTQLIKLKSILEEISTHGRIIVKKAYGDWKNASLKNWEDELKRLAIRPEQQFAYVTGKNATDIAMVIGAMDLLHTGVYDAFVLVSSDSDFTPLAIRLRESGVYVFGVGEEKTPQSFKNACDDFILIEYLSNTNKRIDKGNTDKNNTDKNNTDKNNTDKNNTDKNNTDKSNTDKNNTDKSNTDKNNTDKNNTGRSNTDKNNTENTNTENTNTDRGNTRKINVGKSSTEKTNLENINMQKANTEKINSKNAELKKINTVEIEMNKSVDILEETEQIDIEEIHDLLKIAYEKYQDEDGLVNISHAGGFIKRAKPDFNPRMYGFAKLSDLIKKFPKKYEIKKYKGKGTASITAYRCL